MKQFRYVLSAEHGIHAHPADRIAKAARIYTDTDIVIDCAGRCAKATQPMKVIALGAKQGSVVTVSASGAHEGAALAAMDDLFTAHL